MRALYLVIGILIGAAIAAPHLTAGERWEIQVDTFCGTYKWLRDSLFKAGEKPQHIALAQSGAVVEIFVSDAKNWSFIRTDTSGRSCMVDTGTSWENIHPLGRRS